MSSCEEVNAAHEMRRFRDEKKSAECYRGSEDLNTFADFLPVTIE